jgi:hypothetical protein
MFGDPSVKTRASTNAVYNSASIPQACTRGNGLEEHGFEEQAGRRERPDFLAEMTRCLDIDVVV